MKWKLGVAYNYHKKMDWWDFTIDSQLEYNFWIFQGMVLETKTSEEKYNPFISNVDVNWI